MSISLHQTVNVYLGSVRDACPERIYLCYALNSSTLSASGEARERGSCG